VYAAPDYNIPPLPSASYANPSRATYAGFWIRAFAYLIDSTLLSVAAFIIGYLAFPHTHSVAGILDFSQSNAPLGLLALVYFPLCWSNLLGGATLGMRLLSLHVVNDRGETIGLPHAFLRLFGLILAFLVCYIGVIWVAFDPEKRGWHDFLASTRVVHNLHR
jgi:uncharacterized RDD family membrane protein YckC